MFYFTTFGLTITNTVREEKQLSQILELLEIYLELDVKLPLHIFLKNHFSKNKQMGSRDRRNYSQSFYNYFRISPFLANEEKPFIMALSCYLLESEPSELQHYLLKTFTALTNENWNDSFDKKLKLIQEKYPLFVLKNNLFQNIELSEGIDFADYSLSFLKQPALFIRVVKNKINLVKKELDEKNVSYSLIENMPNTIAFSNKTQLNDLQSKTKNYFEIQDLSSQKIGNYFTPNANEKWWDCCAASGGKSLMLLEKEPSINLYVSDVRESILNNLQIRFKNVGVRNYKSAVADLTQSDSIPFKEVFFDAIVADVPCSGSGTWARTPEMVSVFDLDELKNYQKRQIEITLNALSRLNKNGLLYYITCSVFKQENEDVVNIIQQKAGMKIEKMELINGIKFAADTMFIAVLRK